MGHATDKAAIQAAATLVVDGLASGHLPENLRLPRHETHMKPDSDPKMGDVRVEPDSDIVWIPVKLYEFFLAHGKDGSDARTVLAHLIYTARRQHNNRVWATTAYISKGTGLSEKRTRAAKAFLEDYGFVTYHQRPPASGEPHFGKVYTEVRFPTLPSKSDEGEGKERAPAESAPAENGVVNTRVGKKGGAAESSAAPTPVKTEAARKKGRRNPLEPWAECLAEARAMYKDRYGFGLQLQVKQTQKAFRDVGATRDQILAAFKIYLDDPGDDGYLLKRIHPWRIFISQLGTYVGKARQCDGSAADPETLRQIARAKATEESVKEKQNV